MIAFIEDHRAVFGVEPICPAARQGIAQQCPRGGSADRPFNVLCADGHWA